MVNEERFWSKFDIKGPDDCWEWQGGTGSHGYGKFTNGRKWEMLHHRLAYTLTYGEIPKGQVVRHKCDNKLCGNPAHLELGSQADNVQDCWERGQFQRDLTWEQIKEIKERLKEGTRGIGKQLAAEYETSPSIISRIKTGKIYKEAEQSISTEPSCLWQLSS